MSNFDYRAARILLASLFREITNPPSPLANDLLKTYSDAFDTVFESKTQSYREVLLGCALMRLINPSINIRLPYIKQGSDSFNGRTLDEQVINPFLISRQIPCSKGPYLATFRRNVKLDASTKSGLRDQIGYEAMLTLLDLIESCHGDESRAVVACLLHKFIDLREKSNIQLVTVARLSVEQSRYFLDTLLHNQSGGLIPMLITEAIYETINEEYCCGWEIEHQGINSADGATGAAGDITIKSGLNIVKAIEVTERPIGAARVVTTFSTKIITSDIKEYLFVYTANAPDDDAYAAAKTYFAQGYDINFVKLNNFVIAIFMAGRAETRNIFMDKMLALLSRGSIPASVKTAWNDSLQATINA